MLLPASNGSARASPACARRAGHSGMRGRASPKRIVGYATNTRHFVRAWSCTGQAVPGRPWPFRWHDPCSPSEAGPADGIVAPGAAIAADPPGPAPRRTRAPRRAFRNSPIWAVAIRRSIITKILWRRWFGAADDAVGTGTVVAPARGGCQAPADLRRRLPAPSPRPAARPVATGDRRPPSFATAERLKDAYPRRVRAIRSRVTADEAAPSAKIHGLVSADDVLRAALANQRVKPEVSSYP